MLWLNASLLLTSLHLAFTAHNTVAFEITGRNSAVGLLSFAIGIALLSTTPFAGAVADRMSKRLLLVLTQSLLLIMAGGLALFLYLDILTIGMMMVFGFMFGACISFFWPTITACMGETVDLDKQANGAALFQIALNLTRSFSPFVGAALLSWHAVGLWGAYVAVAILLVPTVASIALIPKGNARPARAARPSMLAEMRLGLRHVIETPALRVAMASFVVTILLAFSMMVVLPAFAKDVLGAGDAGFGIMFGTHAAGGLVAGLFVASKASSDRLGAYLFVIGVLLGVSISVLAFMPNFALSLVAVFFVGGGAGAFQTLIMAAILRASAPEYFGRVVALANIGWALNNLFGLLLGVMADATSERLSLFVLGLLVVTATVLLTLWRARVERQPHLAKVPA